MGKCWYLSVLGCSAWQNEWVFNRNIWSTSSRQINYFHAALTYSRNYSNSFPSLSPVFILCDGNQSVQWHLSALARFMSNGVFYSSCRSFCIFQTWLNSISDIKSLWQETLLSCHIVYNDHQSFHILLWFVNILQS